MLLRRTNHIRGRCTTFHKTMKNLTITILLLVLFSCQNATEKKNKQVQIEVDSTGLKINKIDNQKSPLIDSGVWINSMDSMSSVEIIQRQWVFKYGNEKPESNDYYNYQIAESAFDKENAIIGGFITISNETDTLKYEIDYISDKSMTLTYLARGNSHNYLKKE